jgi:hypothetical protein
MIKRVVLLLSLMTLSTMALAQTSVSSPGLNCIQPQAVGDGVADDTAALQNAFNMAGTAWRSVCLQPGRYKYSNDLILPSRVSVYGLTGSFNNGVEMDPVGGARLVIDGSTQPGSWHVRSTISNLTLKLSGSQASAIYINQSYHLTFDHVAIYSANYATTAALNIGNITTFVCNFCVIWGNQSAPGGTGILVNAFDAQIQMNSPNIEGMNVGMSISGGTQLTMIEPWFEKNITGYVHNTTFGSGSARIFGGTFSLPVGGSAATGIDVQGDHLLVQGTLFENLGSAAYGLALPKPIYTDVKLLGIPSISSPNIFQTGANLMGVQVDPPRPSRLFPGRIHFVKQVISGAPTGILKLSSFSQFSRFRLILTAYDGNGFQTKQYDFGLTANTIRGNVIETPLSTYSNTNWQLALVSGLQFTASGSDLTVSITATEAGLLGQGHNPTIVGELEVLNFEPAAATGAINLL